MGMGWPVSSDKWKAPLDFSINSYTKSQNKAKVLQLRPLQSDLTFADNGFR